MNFSGQVSKRVWEMAFFWSEIGLDFEMRAAHPLQKFQEVHPPPPPPPPPPLSVTVTAAGASSFA